MNINESQLVASSRSGGKGYRVTSYRFSDLPGERANNAYLAVASRLG